MRKVFLFLFLALFLSAGSQAAEKIYGSATATVVNVHDGDTITVNLDGEWPPIIGEHLGVRVDGIDTRELNQGGEAARDYVRTLIPIGAVIHLSEMKRDKYFCIVAKVGFDCKDLDIEPPMCSDLSLTLIKHKYAIPYDGETKHPFPKDIK